jgi:hypothetical protein
MKKILFLCVTLLFFRTSPVFGELVILSPEEMLARAQVIVAGEVREIRPDREQPAIVLQVDTVYRGSTASPLLVLPLPVMPGPDAKERTAGAAPPVGSRLLLLLVLDDAGRLVPAADLNWMTLMADGVATNLFFGASTKDWREADYVIAFNGFLAQAGAERKTEAVEETQPPAAPAERSPVSALKSLPLLLAGMFLLALVLSRQIRKASDRKGRNRPDF